MWVLIIIFLLLVYIIYDKTNHTRKLAADFPGEPDLPLIGNMLQLGLDSRELLNKLSYMHKKYSYDFFRLYIGTKLNLIVTNPDDVGVILMNTTDFKKSEDFRFLKPWLGEGLILAEGQKWKKNRKIITPSFHFKILQSYAVVMDKQGDKLITKLAKVADGQIVNVWDFISKCALDLISETAMGVPVDAQDNPNSELVLAIHALCNVFANRFVNPFKWPEFLFNLSRDSTKHKKALKIVKDFNERIILKKRNRLEEELKNKGNVYEDDDENKEEEKKKLSFLDILLTADIDGEPLSNKDISDEVSNFMFAGHDTMTATINYALYNLANNPEIQDKVLNEQIQLLGTDLQRSATFQELQSMNYLDLFIKETVRLYPGVPILGKHVIRDTNINGKIFPAGANVLFFVYGMHRNPRTFPDPEKVDPDRFLPENRINKHPYEYIPFSGGPRNCVGQKFAIMEMKSLLSKLVRHYEFISGGPENAARPFVSITLNSRNGIHIRINPRKY